MASVLGLRERIGSAAFQRKRQIFVIFMPTEKDVQILSTMSYVFGKRGLGNVRAAPSTALISLLQKHAPL
jgi:hypothetical protein